MKKEYLFPKDFLDKLKELQQEWQDEELKYYEESILQVILDAVKFSKKIE